LLLRIMNTSDVKLQKTVLDCLIKTDYKDGVLKIYQKTLQGFADDEQFKDMIQTLVHGSSTGNNDAANVSKKGDKGSTQKLQDHHRMDVLPIVIKLLLSKLIKKKGAINKKTIYVRRNIVF